MNFLKKTFFLISAITISVSAQQAPFVMPDKMRAGPVSQYGALGTYGNRVVSIANPQKTVMLRGMSLFWSDGTGIPYYNGDVASWAVDVLKVDGLRYALAVKCYDSQGGDCQPGTSGAVTNGYIANPAGAKNSIENMVKVAIENDIYLIIDWHSHRAEAFEEKVAALEFFTWAAERFKDVPNIIWEVYNEPVNQSWATIRQYANDVIAAIRQYSPNLALVGTKNWSQMPDNIGTSNRVNGTNVGYVFHFYANTHGLAQFQGNIDRERSAGNVVFVTEWGTTSANGGGTPNQSATTTWTNYMDQNNISNFNWSIRHGGGGEETSAFFQTNDIVNTKTKLDTAKLSASGTMVKNYLTSKGRNWADSLGVAGRCQFRPVTVKETAGTATGPVAGCTYTSSNDAVASVSGTTIQVKKAGLTVMTGNDGSKSIVTVTRMPNQQLSFNASICRLNNTCNFGDVLADLSGQGQKELKLNVVTIEGQSVTVTSGNQSVISVTKAKCTGSGCQGGARNQDIWALNFKTLGESQIRIQAPGNTNYKALDTTVTMKYRKNIQRLASSFKNITVQPGSTTPDMLPDTTIYEGAQVTYNFGEGASFAHKEGTSLVAGMQDYTVNITAHAQETETYEALGTDDFGNILGITRTVTIGAGSSIKVSQVRVPFQWSMAPEGINLHLERSGAVTLRFLDASGREVTPKMVENFDAGNHWVSLSHLSSGNYFIQIRQGSSSGTFRWFKK